MKNLEVGALEAMLHKRSDEQLHRQLADAFRPLREIVNYVEKAGVFGRDGGAELGGPLALNRLESATFETLRDERRKAAIEEFLSSVDAMRANALEQSLALSTNVPIPAGALADSQTDE